MKRSHIMLTISVILIVAAALQSVFVAPSLTAYAVGQKEEKIVTRVVDGDTIVVEGGDRIRLVNIDTPERGEPCYKEAKDRLTELIDGENVVLERAGENEDSYGRLLRYVFYNSTNINVLLVREGLANTYFYNKNTPYYEELIGAEQAAKGEGSCVWRK